MQAPPSSSSIQSPQAEPPPPVAPTRLGRVDDDREVVVLAAIDRSLLVVDRRSADASDARLVARIAADEPVANAGLVADLYLSDARRPVCRELNACDFMRQPEVDLLRQPLTACARRTSLGFGHGPPALPDQAILCDRHGIRFRLTAVATSTDRAPELRWLRESPAGTQGAAECVSVRRVVGALEDYEPARSLTTAAIERHRRDPNVSVATLGLELRRLGASPIVLNRRLREAVLDASARQGLSLSSIALACGRAKLDRRGRHSGETSWLARRVGLVSDDASRRPNPWVHSDVLALIARNGLGIAPHEVELG
jgi:hypothetical protein